ncbi:hypothetical protein AgCh_010956 [Apium graveolens]
MARMQKFEETLKISPKDSTALEGEAAILAELGEYTRAASLLEDIIKNEPSSDAFRLLGEVQFNLKDYEGSAAAYKSSVTMAKAVNFEVLRGLTNSLLAAKRPEEAVQFLLVLRERLHLEKSEGVSTKVDDTATVELAEVDPIQQSRRVITRGPKVKRLFPIQFPSACRSFPIVSCNFARIDYHAWHKRPGHPNNDILRGLLKSGVLGNTKLLSLNSVQFDCNSCKLGKSKTLPFSIHTSDVTQPFDLIHSDVWGMSQVVSHANPPRADSFAANPIQAAPPPQNDSLVADPIQAVPLIDIALE